MIAAYNDIAQDYLDWFNGICLGDYTSSVVAGPLLDWLAAGIYGMYRVPLGISTTSTKGALNTVIFNGVVFNGELAQTSGTSSPMTDDIFKRCITWNFYKGDGTQFSTRWLKSRITRFLTGVDGTTNTFSQTYSVSVVFPSTSQVNITLPHAYSQIGGVFSLCLASGILNVPLGLTINVTISAS